MKIGEVWYFCIVGFDCLSGVNIFLINNKKIESNKIGVNIFLIWLISLDGFKFS